MRRRETDEGGIRVRWREETVSSRPHQTLDEIVFHPWHGYPGPISNHCPPPDDGGGQPQKTFTAVVVRWRQTGLMGSTLFPWRVRQGSFHRGGSNFQSRGIVLPGWCPSQNPWCLLHHRSLTSRWARQVWVAIYRPRPEGGGWFTLPRQDCGDDPHREVLLSFSPFLVTAISFAPSLMGPGGFQYYYLLKRHKLSQWWVRRSTMQRPCLRYGS